MAILHEATLTPTKLDLLTAWLPGRPWYRGPAQPTLRRVASARFDDPAGEVGIEIMVVDAGRGPLHVPLTYRAERLDGADDSLIGMMRHSVLGERWAYDACGDPVYVQALRRTILEGGHEAEQFLRSADGQQVRREPDLRLAGSGPRSGADPVADPVVRVDEAEPTHIVVGDTELVVARVLDVTGGTAPGGLTLTGTWTDQTTPVLFAWIRTA